MLCCITRMMPALIFCLSGSPVGILSSSFMCSLSESVKTLLFPPVCSLRLQGSYRELVFTHARRKAHFICSDNLESPGDGVPQVAEDFNFPNRMNFRWYLCKIIFLVCLVVDFCSCLWLSLSVVSSQIKLHMMGWQQGKGGRAGTFPCALQWFLPQRDLGPVSYLWILL